MNITDCDWQLIILRTVSFHWSFDLRTPPLVEKCMLLLEVNLPLEIADVSCCNLVSISYIIEDIVWKQVGILLRPCVLASSLICIVHILRHNRLLGDRHNRNQKGRAKLKTLVSCCPGVLHFPVYSLATLPSTLFPFHQPFCTILHYLATFQITQCHRAHPWTIWHHPA